MNPMSLTTTNLFSGLPPVVQFDWEFKPTAYQIDYYNEFIKNNINLSSRSGAREQKKENIIPMETVITKTVKLIKNNHTENQMEVKLTSDYSDSIRIEGFSGDLKDLFESAKTGDEFLFIVIKQPKVEK
jgi:hypothetical protein